MLLIEIENTLLNSAMEFAKSWLLLLLNSLLDEGSTAPNRRRNIQSGKRIFKLLPLNQYFVRFEERRTLL